MKTVNDVFAEGISSAERTVLNAKARLSLIKKSKTVLKSVLQRVLDVIGDNGQVYISTNLWDDKPRLHIQLNRLDGFKDDRLVRVLALLDDVCPEQEVKEYAEYVNRDYTFKGDKFEAVVLAYVKSDSAECRRIKVGTEIVERDKFEIICD